MGFKYIRSLHLFDSDAWKRAQQKAVYQFLKYGCGWTNDATNADFDSVEFSGSDATFDGTSWVLTSAAAPFSATDVKKLILLNAPDDSVTTGVYMIKRYISATQVEIDFRADPTSEFPADNTLGTPITYRVWAHDYASPSSNGDYWRIQSPDSSNWAIEWRYYSADEAWIRIAVDGNWGGAKFIGGDSSSENDLNYGIDNGEGHGFINVIAEDNGELLLVTNTHYATQYNAFRYNYASAFMVNKFIPHGGLSLAAEEKVALFGQRTRKNNWLWERVNDNYRMTRFRSWSNYHSTYLTGYVTENINYRETSAITHKSNWPNSFRDTKTRSYDFVGPLANKEGDTLITDDLYNNELKYQKLGATQHYYVIPPVHVNFGASEASWGYLAATSPHKTLSKTSNTSKGILTYPCGWAFPWPENISFVLF